MNLEKNLAEIESLLESQRLFRDSVSEPMQSRMQAAAQAGSAEAYMRSLLRTTAMQKLADLRRSDPVPPAPEAAPAEAPVPREEAPAQREWQYFRGESKCGPVSEDYLRGMLASGALPADTPVWTNDMTEWGKAYEVGLASAPPPAPPPVVAQPEAALCRTCGAELPPSARFCQACGSPIAPAVPAVNAQTVCPACGANVQPGAKFCESCGAAILSAPAAPVILTCPGCGWPIKPDAKFCEGCGRAFDHEFAQVEKHERG